MKAKRKLSKARRIFNLILLILMPLVFYSCVDELIFFPPARSYKPSAHLINIPVENNQHIAMLYLPATNDGFVVLFSHRNAEDIGQLRAFAQHYQLTGCGILAYDYRGYGLSDGNPSETNTYRDIAAAYHYLVDQQKIAPSRIIVHGRSVGSGPSVWLAAQYPVGPLVLGSPFISVFRVRTHWPILPFDKYNNLARIKNIHCPLLVIHGQKDRIVGFWHGQALYNAADDPKMHYWVPNAGHNNLIHTAGDEYWKTLQAFQNMVHQHQKEKRISIAD